MTTQWSPEWRQEKIDSLTAQRTQFDMIVVGGGITGAGIYREAVARGLKVLLVEQQDFSWGTSSRSSKMVHGGLRYLATGQLKIASDSASERQKLLVELAGLVNPLPFLMGHYKGGFPGPWLFDKVLAVYDWMAHARYRRYWPDNIPFFFVPGMKQEGLKGATQFGDASVDDSRLVLRTLQDANEQGGMALNYLKATNTLRNNGHVTGLTLTDQLTGHTFDVDASVVICATGAWTDELRGTLGHHKVIRPLRGSHLVLPFWRLPVSYSVTFNHPDDKRPVFVFPWEGVTVIGTTDLDHKGPLEQEASISHDEVDYLINAANSQFPDAALCRDDMLSSWAGVRPVVSHNQDQAIDLEKQVNPSDEKREHAIWDDGGMISVAGGKLTTFRLIALDVLKRAADHLGEKLPKKSLDHCIAFTTEASPSNQRLAGCFGRHSDEICSLEPPVTWDPQQTIATTETRWAELIWSCQHEMVLHLDDLLLRRSRVGLVLKDGGDEVMPQIRMICQQYLRWDDAHWQDEFTRYQQIIQQHYSLPQGAAC